MKVKYIGFGGYMEVPCYQDEDGTLTVDQVDSIENKFEELQHCISSCI